MGYYSRFPLRDPNLYQRDPNLYAGYGSPYGSRTPRGTGSEAARAELLAAQATFTPRANMPVAPMDERPAPRDYHRSFGLAPASRYSYPGMRFPGPGLPPHAGRSPHHGGYRF